MTAIYADSVTVTNNVTTRPATTDGPAGWVDGLDTTYAEVWREGHSPTPSSIVDNIYATFPAYAATDLEPFARLAVYLDAGAIDTHKIAFEMDDFSDLGNPFIGWFRPFTSLGELPSSGAIYDATTWYWEDQHGGSDKTRLLAVLAAGNLSMRAFPPILPGGWTPGMLWGLFVYEFALNARLAAAPPLRQFPGGARAGATRKYPPNSNQHSPRRIGGTN